MPQMMNLMWLPLMIYFSMAMMMMIFNMKTPFIKNEKYETKKNLKSDHDKLILEIWPLN